MQPPHCAAFKACRRKSDNSLVYSDGADISIKVGNALTDGLIHGISKHNEILGSWRFKILCNKKSTS